MRLLMILLVGTVVTAGCRHRSEAPGNVRVSMDVNIQEAAPPPVMPAPVVKKEQKKAPKERVAPVKNKPKMLNRAKTTALFSFYKLLVDKFAAYPHIANIKTNNI